MHSLARNLALAHGNKLSNGDVDLGDQGGWMETLHTDVEPFGINTTIVEPGFFRTELLVEGASTLWADLSIEDYAERTAATIAAWKGMNGTQGGDPAKLAAALITVTGLDTPPQRWQAGADAVATAEDKAHTLLAQADAHRELSSSLGSDTSELSANAA